MARFDCCRCRTSLSGSDRGATATPRHASLGSTHLHLLPHFVVQFRFGLLHLRMHDLCTELGMGLGLGLLLGLLLLLLQLLPALLQVQIPRGPAQPERGRRVQRCVHRPSRDSVSNSWSMSCCSLRCSPPDNIFRGLLRPLFGEALALIRLP